jgi:hypothetical protein
MSPSSEIFRGSKVNGSPAVVDHVTCCNGQHWSVRWYDAGANVSYDLSLDYDLARPYGEQITPDNARSVPKLIALAASLVVVEQVPLAPALPSTGTIWLDRPLVNWNTPGADVPQAPPGFLNLPDCSAAARAAETDEDMAVTAAGWTLVGPPNAGGGVTAILGTAGFDGMCRPASYQHFIFVDGSFAGTISPDPMPSRADGTGLLDSIDESGTLNATFYRYVPTDPLCCPSRSMLVQFRIDQLDDGPVLVPVSVTPIAN